MLNSPLAPINLLPLSTIHALWIHFASTLRSEGRAKAEWKHRVCRPSIMLYPKCPKSGCHFREKKWHEVGHDDNDNNNNNRYGPLFSPISHPSSQFTLFRLTL